MKCFSRHGMIALISLLSFSQAQAATRVNIEQAQNNFVKGIVANRVIGLDGSNVFEVVKAVQLDTDVTKAKLIQTYKGVRVWNASLASDLDQQGAHQNLSGYYLQDIAADLDSVTPKVNAYAAKSVALKTLSQAQQNKSKLQSQDLYIRQNVQGKAELVYLISILVEDGAQTTRPMFFVNAHTGEIVHQWEGLTTRDATGPGGNQKMGRHHYGTDYGPLIVDDYCRMDSPNVSTYDMRHQQSGNGVLHQFTCPENTYKEINGAYSPINDAHYYGNVVFDMYKDWFNSAPLTFKLKMRVHFSYNFENAFWDGQQMTFGDGASRMYPLVALDVVSHEVSHGFTQQNSNLAYEKMSGGMNESFSDMAGQAAQYYMNRAKPAGQRNDWLVGGDIMKQAEAMRYFDDPTKDGRSIGHAKDYNDSLDVHNSSGVFNKAFYTLSNMPNWDLEKAFRVFVLANQVYWSENSTFTEGACGSAKAAADLKFSAPDVRTAFAVVGVTTDTACGGGSTDPDPDPTPTPGEGEILLGKPVGDLSGEYTAEKHYYVDVPSSAYELAVQTYGGFGDVDLYVKYAGKPTVFDYDCRSNNKSNDELCRMVARPGRYHIMLKGYLPYQGVTLLAKVTANKQ